MATGEIQLSTEVRGEELDERELLQNVVFMNGMAVALRNIAPDGGVDCVTRPVNLRYENLCANAMIKIIDYARRMPSDSIVSHNVLPPAIGVSDPPANPRINYYALKCAIGASVTTIFLGFNIGGMSDAAAYIKKDKRITDDQVDQQATYLYWFSILGSMIAGPISDWIGRHSTIMWTGGFFSIGTLLMGFAPNNALITVGRIVNQVSIGLALMITPVYIAEVSPPSSRGFLTSFSEVAINVGTFLGYLCSYSISKVQYRRYFMVGLGVISPFLVAIGVFAMPESPRWLVMQGRSGEANDILEKTCDSEQEASHQLAEIEEAVGNMQRTGCCVWRELCCHRSPFVWHIVICVLLINIIQQASGIDVILLYSTRIYEKAGVTSNNEKLFWTVVVHFVKALCLLIPILCLDTVGRKKLLLGSIGATIVSLASLGTCLNIIGDPDKSDKKHNWAVGYCVPLFLLYVGSVSSGVGPIPSVYSSEVFPSRLRAQGYALGIAANQAAGLAFSAIFLQHYDATTAVFSFMVCGFFAFAFVYFVMPETKGRTLEDLWKFLGDYIVRRSTSGERELRRNIEAVEAAAIELERHIEATEAVARSTAGDIELQRNVEATGAAARVDSEALP